MKKLKTIACLMILFLLGTTYSYGQEKSTVLIETYVVGDSYTIHTVKPDYTSYKLEPSKELREPARIALKKELDKWVLEGYVIANSTEFSMANGLSKSIYYLVKE